MATKRAMATAPWVAGGKEGNGKGGKGNGDGNKGLWQGMGMATKRAMATAMRVVGDKEGGGNKDGNGDSNEGSRQLRGQ
jgi:hypothetical protein